MTALPISQRGNPSVSFFKAMAASADDIAAWFASDAAAIDLERAYPAERLA